MKKKNFIYILSFFIFLSCLIAINNYYSSNLYVTTIQIDQKKQSDSVYVITATTGDNKKLEFQFSDSDLIGVKVSESEFEEKRINTFWDDIVVGEKYYVVYNELRFPYNLFDSDIKLRQIHFY